MNQCFFQLVKVVSLDVEEKVRIPICTDVRKSLARVDSQFYIELLEMLLVVLANGPGDLKASVLKVFLPDGVDILTLAFYFILIALWIAAQNFPELPQRYLHIILAAQHITVAQLSLVPYRTLRAVEVLHYRVAMSLEFILAILIFSGLIHNQSRYVQSHLTVTSDILIRSVKFQNLCIHNPSILFCLQRYNFFPRAQRGQALLCPFRSFFEEKFGCLTENHYLCSVN